MRDECVEAARRAILTQSARLRHAWEDGGGDPEAFPAIPTDLVATAALDAILAVMAEQECVMHDGEGVIHELRGDPNAIWQAMLKAIQ